MNIENLYDKILDYLLDNGWKENIFGSPLGANPHTYILSKNNIYYYLTIVKNHNNIDIQINNGNKVIHKNQYKKYSEFIDDYTELEFIKQN